MKFPSRPPSSVEGLPGATGPLRVDRRTTSLLRRLRPGDIAVIDHVDLDRATAESLLERDVRAVVNASTFISGRYANLGPQVLVDAGVLLVEGVGPDVFAAVKDGDAGRVHEGVLYVGERPAAEGRAVTRQDIVDQMRLARGGLSTQLQSLTHNTTEFLRREQGLLLHGQGVPRLAAKIHGRPVVVVVQGFDYRDDLKRLRRFIREQHPILIGVDSGADALLAAGHKPHLVVAGQNAFAHAGSTQQRPVSDAAFKAAGEVVIHTDESGRVVGADKVEKLGVRAKTMSAAGTSEDVALLLADVRGASLIITVGTHATLDEFLDRQREGLASTFLTRLRVGPKLVDAKGVPHLYAGRVRLWQLLLILLAGLAAVAAAIGTTPVGQDWWDSFRDWTQGLT
ncbi:MAG TPA: putative cytokinetic ring protein SteA [Nocardioidaceae bacterium]|nr:putative cytokinetic ring protein SteA [Nocardioidaceae bacterium]